MSASGDGDTASDPGSRAADDLDLRILTPDLAPEEIAAVTSVVAAMVEEQRAAARESAAPEDRWRRSTGPLAPDPRGSGAWRRALR